MAGTYQISEVGPSVVREIIPTLVSPYASIKQALEAMEGINPAARITKVWKGDTWPNTGSVLGLVFDGPELMMFPYEMNENADSFIEFSDGHLIAARTDEQARTSETLRFGKARAGIGSTPKGADRKAKRKGKSR